MLIRLLPEQVSEGWDYIGPVLSVGLPPMQQASAHTMVAMLESILKEESVVWAVMEDAQHALALILTTIYRDPIGKQPYLLIYAFTSLGNLSEEQWKESLDTLRDYAIRLKVESILAYTSNKTIAKMCVDRLGASADFILLEFD